jgi:hypothetical protein
MKTPCQLPRGTFVIGRKLYCTCQHCGALVCLNKWLIGSLHICLSDEEMAAKRAGRITSPPPQTR